MIEINLLPQGYRKGERGLSLGKTGVYALIGIVGIVLGLIGVTFYQMHQLSALEEAIEINNHRAATLRADIQVVDALNDVKAKIQRRMSAVERLDRHRSAWVRILEDMGRNVPEYVWLSKFTEAEVVAAETDTATATLDRVETAPVRPIELRGYTFTLNALAAFMIRMMRSDYFDQVELVDSRDTLFSDEKAYTFQLSANVHYLSDEELQNMIAQAAGEPGITHKSLN